MGKRNILRRLPHVLSVAALLIVLTGCGGSGASPGPGVESFGPAQSLGNGSARTYVVVGSDGRPSEVGVRLSVTAMDGLPTADMDDHAALAAITPADPGFAAKAAHLPDPKYVPLDFVIPPGPPAAVLAVPGMGLHLSDGADKSLVPGSYDFTRTFINGGWDGRYTFMEPMITREWLLTRPDMPPVPIKQPQAYQLTGYYPTTFAVHFDDHANEYVIALGGLTMRTAS